MWKILIYCIIMIHHVVDNFEFSSINPYCLVKECCTNTYITADFEQLEKSLHDRVYGQHLVQDIVVSALRVHWSPDHKPQKPLTLSFHGWPGSGKNYVSKFIIDSLYRYGSKSIFVKHYIGRIHFPLKEEVPKYQLELYDFIRERVRSCPKQLFIFDEVDKMPPNLLNVIKPIIDYRDDVEGVDYRQAIFVFLSNTGANTINEHVLHWWRSGKDRSELKLSDFEKLIARGAFNEEGGFHHSDTIRSNLIDHYIPFLPMEHKHVKMCILDEFKQRNVLNPTNEEFVEAMEFIEWGPNPEKIFSKTGCKRLSQKVGIIAAKRKLQFNNHKHEL